MGMQNKAFGDLITFTRASGGTSFRPVGYGPELVTNGGPFTSTAGYLPLNSSTASVVGDKLRLTRGADAGTQVCRFSVPGLTPGKAYQTVLTLTSNPYNISVGHDNYITGTYTPIAALRSVVTAVSTSGDVYIQLLTGSAGQYVEFSSISVQEVILDRAGDPIELFTSPTNVPRIDYDPVTGACKGLLIEEQRVNYRPTSDIFSTFVKRNNIPVITDNVAIAPNGQQVAALISGAGTVIWDGASSVQVGISGLPADSTCTLSMYFKSAGATTVSINCRNQNTGAIGTGTLALDGTWKRISATQQIGANGQVGITIGQADGDFLVAHCQLEVGPFPTSYIPTTGAAATRAADVASINTLSPWYNSAEGTLFAEATLAHSATAQNTVAALSRSDTSLADRVELCFNSAGNPRVEASNAGASVMNNIGSAGASVNKMVYAWSGSGGASANNGAAVATNATAVGASNLTRLQIGARADTSTPMRNGHIRAIRYTPKRLSDAQLQAMTT